MRNKDISRSKNAPRPSWPLSDPSTKQIPRGFCRTGTCYLKKGYFYSLRIAFFSPVNKCTVVSYKDLLEQLIIPGAPQAIAATAGITYSRQSTLLTGIINIFRNIQQPMRWVRQNLTSFGYKKIIGKALKIMESSCFPDKPNPHPQVPHPHIFRHFQSVQTRLKTWLKHLCEGRCKTSGLTRAGINFIYSPSSIVEHPAGQKHLFYNF